MTTPHEEIPNTYRDVRFDTPQAGFSIGGASYAELRVAGFHGGPEAKPIEREPGSAPLEELLVSDKVTDVPVKTVLAEAEFRVLRDGDSTIVATWDAGRWWTIEESDAFTAALAAEFDEDV